MGSGLQVGASVNLDATNHGGVTVHVASADPAVLLVSPDATTPGTASIDVVVPNGTGSFSYYVQGVEGATGTPAITASAPGFTTGTNTATVQQAAFELQGLPATTTTLSPDNVLYVQVGLSNSPFTSLYTVQNVRAGAPGPLTVSFTVADPAVGTLVTSAGTGTTRTAQIPSGLYYTPTTVASGGVAFRPVGGGTTTVTTALASYIATTSATRTVTVAAPQITLSAPTVGSGLQVGASVNLNATNHGGVTVHVASADSGRAAGVARCNHAGNGLDRCGGAQRDRVVQLLRAGGGAGDRYPGDHRLRARVHHRDRTARRCSRRPTKSRGSITKPTPSRPTIRSTSRSGCPTACNPSLYTVQNVRAGAPGPLIGHAEQLDAGRGHPGDLGRQRRDPHGPDPDRPLLLTDLGGHRRGGVQRPARRYDRCVSASIPNLIATTVGGPDGHRLGSGHYGQQPHCRCGTPGRRLGEPGDQHTTVASPFTCRARSRRCS